MTVIDGVRIDRSLNYPLEEYKVGMKDDKIVFNRSAGSNDKF